MLHLPYYYLGLAEKAISTAAQLILAAVLG
jgi:hypothetical protein